MTDKVRAAFDALMDAAATAETLLAHALADGMIAEEVEDRFEAWRKELLAAHGMARAALAAAPQPAPTHECPVCEETVTWTRPGSPYCGECAADNGRDVRMRSIGTASQPAPDREALVEVIAQIIDHPSVYMGGPSRNSLRIADAIVKECGNALPPPGRAAPKQGET